jgi:hypothetical protein
LRSGYAGRRGAIKFFEKPTHQSRERNEPGNVWRRQQLTVSIVGATHEDQTSCEEKHQHRYAELIRLREQIERLEVETTPNLDQPDGTLPMFNVMQDVSGTEWNEPKGRTRFQN